ncbi:MAG TPA: CHAT domain-containing tetratricopeptide repeat protein, partial [Bryobacteraceae bacterium]|nr:CHAT domain-containing tetratricopeptide repeat protein [Bryobacteraceae bacterium]
MRACLGLLVLLFAACGRGTPSLDADFRTIRNLLLTERYDLALPITERDLNYCERSGQTRDVWRFRLLKADILIGKRQSAQTLSVLDAFGDPPAGAEWAETRAHLLLLKGRALYGLNRFSESEEVLGRAAAAARQAASQSLSAEVLLRQGFLMALRSNFEQARAAFESVAETAHRFGDPYQEASAIGNIGYALLTESRNDEAIPWFERAIEIFSKIDAPDSVARNRGNLGNCYFHLGDYDNARLQYEKAQAWFSKTGNQMNQQIWIGNAANVSYETGDYAAAEAGYRQALQIARQVSSPVWIERWLMNLASTSLELGNWDAAETYNNSALVQTRQLQDTGYEPTALVNAARIEEGRQHFDRARDLYHSALAKRSEDPTTPLEAHSGLARTCIREGRSREAEAEFNNTVATIGKRGANLLKDDYKLTYLASLIQFYREYVDFLIANHQPERALEVAESSRSHVLQQKSGGVETAPHTASDYRRLARETRSVVLEYWLSPGQSYLWVITPDAIRLHTLPDQKAIQPLIDSYRAVVTGGRNPLEVASDTGRKLFEILLTPAETASDRYLIVPDGALSSFPLESLPAPGDSRKFWIEQASVAFAPSLNYLAGQSRAASTTRGMQLLAIGDPSSSSPQYPHLEFASRELDSIASAMDPSKTAIFRGEAATPASYASATPAHFQFIHFAAHATANAQSPLDSAVILSGPMEKNRLLARDVAEIPLSAELVTISACRSAGGKTYAGEGLVGFAWAFLRAGARNVIAGFWDVSDRSTTLLMTSLYRGLASGKDVSDALRTAKLDLIHSGGSYAKP